MLLVEGIERSGKKLALQVFATDADASAVDGLMDSAAYQGTLGE